MSVRATLVEFVQGKPQRRVAVDHIHRFSSVRGRVYAFTAEQSYPLAERESLSYLAQEFDADFIRIHSGHLVRASLIEGIDYDRISHTYSLWLQSEHHPLLPLSKAHVPAVATDMVGRARRIQLNALPAQPWSPHDQN